MKKIYLDYAATTPQDEEVTKEMLPYFSEKFGNPSSIHQFGQEALQAVDNARSQVAEFLGASPREIVFTSGATESNNMAIKGTLKATTVENPHIITSSIEHHCVLNTCEVLKKEGNDITFLRVDKDALINPKDVRGAIKDNTILVSIMYANNEVGTIEPIAEIGNILKEVNRGREMKKLPKVYFHVDAVQAVNYLDCNVDSLGVDYLSISGHKFYGPKGIGALYIRQGTKFRSIQQGGEQEYNLRAGTHNVPGIVGLGKAIAMISKRHKNTEKIRKMRDMLIEGINKTIPEAKLNGSQESRLPHNVNFSFKGIEGESLLMMLDQEGIAVSTGSACSSASLEPSHVLMAMGIPPEIAHASVRFTLGKDTTEEDIKFVLAILPKKIKRLREISGM